MDHGPWAMVSMPFDQIVNANRVTNEHGNKKEIRIYFCHYSLNDIKTPKTLFLFLFVDLVMGYG